MAQQPAAQTRPAALQQARAPQMRVLPQPAEQASRQQQEMMRQQQEQAMRQAMPPPPPPSVVAAAAGSVGGPEPQQFVERPNFQMALLPPPQDRLYHDFASLMADLRTFTRSQGYAVVIGSSVNRDANGKYRRYNISCAKGGKGYQSKNNGQRQSRSNKTGCPMKLKAIQERAFP